MSEGWISLHRQLKENWIWQDKAKFDKRSAWIDILLSVNHQDNKFLLGSNIVNVKRGQHLTSEVKLSNRWGWDRKTVRRFLDLLEKDGMIKKIVEPNKYIVVQVVNYDRYQFATTLSTTQSIEIPMDNNVGGTTQGTSSGQLRDNSGTTQGQQEHTNNNDNNENKVKYILRGEQFPNFYKWIEKFPNYTIENERIFYIKYFTEKISFLKSKHGEDHVDVLNVKRQLDEQVSKLSELEKEEYRRLFSNRSCS